VPTIDVEPETFERLEVLRIDDESDDEFVTELLNIEQAGELTPFHASEAR
jgi:hypothetical protein